jgi:hypothetical protein
MAISPCSCRICVLLGLGRGWTASRLSQVPGSDEGFSSLPEARPQDGPGWLTVVETSSGGRHAGGSRPQVTSRREEGQVVLPKATCGSSKRSSEPQLDIDSGLACACQAQVRHRSVNTLVATLTSTAT